MPKRKKNSCAGISKSGKPCVSYAGPDGYCKNCRPRYIREPNHVLNREYFYKSDNAFGINNRNVSEFAIRRSEFPIEKRGV